MNIYKWYKIFNYIEFQATGLVSKEYNLNLEDIGDSVFTAFQGNIVNVGYLDQFLPISAYPEEKYERGNYAVYRNDTNGDVYFGFLVPDEN